MRTKRIVNFVWILLFSLVFLLVSWGIYDYYQDSVSAIQLEGTENTVIGTMVPFNSTPAFLAMPECSTENLGRIIFMRQQSDADTLFIMDGDGCNTRELFSGVSDSPAWAPDAGEVAVGCEDSTSICILNIDNPSVATKRVQLPKKCVGNWIKSISWLPNGNELIVVCGRSSESDELYKISIGPENQYEVILSSEEILRAVASPLDSRLAVSIPPYIYLIDADGSSKTRLTEGISPEWSPDGTKLVFVKPGEEGGIAIINSDGTAFEWLYIPEKPVGLGCSEFRLDCRLSWAPDGQYIVFNGLYLPHIEPGINYQLFRLDLFTKEVKILSNAVDSRFYSEPDWAP